MTGAMALLAASSLLSASCGVEEPSEGEFGRFRYVNRVLGEAPLRLIPPIADISGNIYSLFGALRDFPEQYAFVSRNGGGQAVVCDPASIASTADRFGIHGWVGYAQERVWFWAGDAILQLGPYSFCRRILNFDPNSNTRLLFIGVLPWIYDAPSRTTMVALVRSEVDRLPFMVEIDLNASIFSKIEIFEPGDAQDVTVIGVGGDREANVGFILLQYAQGDSIRVEGRFYDRRATLESVAPIASEPLGEYTINGYLQRSARGLVVGLLNDGRLVSFDRTGGRLSGVGNGMTPIGVHAWEGELYLVGTLDNRPAIAKFDDAGVPGPAMAWSSSEAAAARLAAGPLEVIDDRTIPSRTAVWQQVTTAIGPFPFISEHTLPRHANGTTIWLVAGPVADFGGNKQTSFAMAPVGIRYP